MSLGYSGLFCVNEGKYMENKNTNTYGYARVSHRDQNADRQINKHWYHCIFN
jgi:predicted site-specific integrase-resolvase